MKKAATIWSLLLMVGTLSTSLPAAQHDHGASAHPAHGTARAIPSPPASRLAFEKILDQYYGIQEALANDSTEGVSKAASRITQLASEAEKAGLTKNPDFGAIGRAAKQLQGTNLEQARQRFSELSLPIIYELKRDPSIPKPAFAYKCSMVHKSWVQATKDVRNPYLGKSMQTCGQPM